MNQYQKGEKHSTRTLAEGRGAGWRKTQMRPSPPKTNPLVRSDFGSIPIRPFLKKTGMRPAFWLGREGPERGPALSMGRRAGHGNKSKQKSIDR